MKVFKLLIPFIYFIIFSVNSFAQIEISVGAPYDSPSFLVDSLLIGDGVTSVNQVIQGDPQQIGFFNGVNSNIGLDSGIVIGTGNVSYLVPGALEINIDNNFNDQDLLDVANSVPNLIEQQFNLVSVNDVAVLEFDFVPLSSHISFDYVFASREYFGFENTQFNDVFGFFISGPNIAGPYSSPAEFPDGSINIATFESLEANSNGEDLPITVSSVNEGYNSTYFISNQENGGNTVNFAVDGFTTVFKAEAFVLCGQSYHIRLAIGDGEDQSLPSYVFLGAGSFSSPPLSLTSNLDLDSNKIFSNCGEPATLSTNVGQDLNYEFLWNTGETTPSIEVTPGYYWVQATDSLDCTIISDSIYVYSQPLPKIDMPEVVSFCENSSILIDPEINSGTAPFTYDWGAFGNNSQLEISQEGTYNLSVVDSNGCTDSKDIIVKEKLLPELSFMPENILICGDDVVDVTVSGAKSYKWYPNVGISSDTGSVVEISTQSSISYTLEGTDSIGCVNTKIIPVSSNESFDLDIITTSVNCQGYNDGSITILPQSTAVSPLQYSIDGGESFHSYFFFDNLDYGKYNIVVKDGLGCNKYDTVFIQSAQPEIELLVASTSPQCSNDSMGTISVLNISGGEVSSGYSYKWYNSNNNLIVGTDSIINVPVGGYYLVVEDDNGCKATDEVSVEQPNAIFYTVNKNDVSCFGKWDAQINIEIHGGGTPPYFFDWTNYGNASTSYLYNLGKGVYELDITDANNCLTQVSVDVKESSAPLSLRLDSVDVNCFGDATGVASVEVNGGTTPYFYQWSSGHITNVAEQLNSGIYYIEVTDAMECTIIDSVEVIENIEIVSILSSTPTSCFGSQDGSASIQCSGGTGNLIYNWSNGANVTSINSGYGEYWIKVEDELGCVRYDTIKINQPQKISARLTTKDVNCFGGYDGEIESLVSGGTPFNDQTYMYNWSIDGNTFSTNESIADFLPASTSPYVLKVTDANGCSKTSYSFIGQPTEIKLDTSEIIPAYCYNIPSGMISVVASGGVINSNSNYLFEWSTGDSGAILSNQTAGLYSVIVKDDNSCVDTLEIEIPLEDKFMLEITSDSLNCHDDASGSASVSSVGGYGPYTYNWNASNGLSNEQISLLNTNTIINLSQGITSVVVTDVNGCAKTTQVSVEQPEILEYSIFKINDQSCSGDVSSCDGELKVVASGGIGSYTFKCFDESNNLIQTKQSTSEIIFTDLCANYYQIQVNDERGCLGVLSGSGLPLPVEIVAENSLESSINNSAGSISNNILCFGDTSANLSVSIPNPSYTYDWYVDSLFFASGTNVMVPAGDIYVRAIFSSCSTNSEVITIYQPNILSVESELDSIKCNGDVNGSISIEASGGFPSYSYAWSHMNNPLAGTTDLVDLSAGIYSLKLTDANGCERSFDIEIDEPSPLAVSSVIKDASCKAGVDGSVEFFISGGIIPYSINWQGIDSSALSAGSYSVLISDANSCSEEINVSVGESSEVTASFNPNQIPFTASATGGTPPYTFKWLYFGNYQSSGNSFNPLENGEYTLVATDAKNCDSRIMKIYSNVGVDEIDNLGILIYPNPVKENFIVELQQANDACNEEYTFELFDSRSRLVKKEKFRKKILIDRNEMSKGIYIILISSKNNIYQQKIIFD